MQAHKVGMNYSSSSTHHCRHICPLPVPSQSASHVCSLICREGTCSCLKAEETRDTRAAKVNTLNVNTVLVIPLMTDCLRVQKSSSLPTSKTTETSLFVVFADVWLVVPPDCGSEVFRGPDWSFSVQRIEEKVICSNTD